MTGDEAEVRAVIGRWAPAVHAGDVQGVLALLGGGTPADLDRGPDNRLRLTAGLRKQDGRSVVVHEHHSFASR